MGRIGRGLLALVGTTHGDDEATARLLAGRTSRQRLFPDDSGKTNRSVKDIEGQVLVVSQFTLYANTRKGNRPSFVQVGPPEEARALVDAYRDELERLGVPTAAGVFGAMMQVELVNDGPFTVLLEREPRQ